MSWRYSAFGLNIAADRAIPGLAPRSGAEAADLRICTSGPFPPEHKRGSREYHVSPTRGIHDRPVLRVWASDGFFRLVYDDEAEFLLDTAGTRIWARWPDELTIDDIGPYILGPVLGFALRLRGVTALHASAVVIGGHAVAFLGPPGAGKSTLAAALARRGLPVLSDDIVALTESTKGYVAHSGYPWVRLWPESVEILFGDEEALPRISPDDPDWDKRFLDLSVDSYEFSSTAVPLAAICILAQRSVEEDAPRVVDSTPSETMLALTGNTYLGHVHDTKVRAREFQVLGSLAKRVPVRIVVPHADSDRVEQLCDVILDEFSDLFETSI